MSPKPKMIERRYDATQAELWELWTTKRGLEAWWGPGGHSVEVLSLDLQPGGELRYMLTATAADQVAATIKAGKPLSTERSIRFTDVAPPRLLAFVTRIDTVTGVEPYDATTKIEFGSDRGAIKMTLTLGEMHDENAIQRAFEARATEVLKLTRYLRESR
jgi:uncharacterized protein YndB with AHSA1/START domain